LRHYRDPLVPEMKIQIHRQLYRFRNAEALRFAFRQMLETVRPWMTETVSRINQTYHVGRVNQTTAEVKLADIGKRPGLTWNEGEIGEYALPSRAAYVAAMQVELDAELTLLTLDGIVTGLVNALTLEDRPLGVGGALEGDVRLDVLLDAAANFVRHRSEWLTAVRDGRPLERRQLESIEPLARSISGNAKLSSGAAASFLFDFPMPMLAVLDIIAGYDRASCVSYALIEDRIVALGHTIIEHEFVAWMTQPNTRRSQRQRL